MIESENVLASRSREISNSSSMTVTPEAERLNRTPDLNISASRAVFLVDKVRGFLGIPFPTFHSTNNALVLIPFPSYNVFHFISSLNHSWLEKIGWLTIIDVYIMWLTEGGGRTACFWDLWALYQKRADTVGSESLVH